MQLTGTFANDSLPVRGLTIATSDVTIRGLAITKFSGAISIFSSTQATNNNSIESCYIGLNADGNHWRELAKIEHDRYESAFARISLQLDQNQDGLVDNPLARSAGTGTISFNGGQPRYSLRGTFGRYGL